MRRFVFLAVAVSTSAFAATVAPPCTTESAAAYTAQGACTIAAAGVDWTIKRVFWESTGSFDLPDTRVTLSPVVGPGLSFTFPGGISVPAGQEMVAEFHYIIDPPPPILDGFRVRLDPTGASSLSGFVLYAATRLVGNTLVFDQTGTFPINAQGDSAFHYTLTDSQSFEFPANYVEVDLHITVGGNNKPATANGGVTSAVPEPAALGLAGAGLAVLAMLRRRTAR